MLSIGRFATEIDLTLRVYIRESLRYEKLIGPLDDEDSLYEYSNTLIRRFIQEQVIYYPNTKRVIDIWITIAGELFDDIIVHNMIPITSMPPAQQSTLFASIEEESIAYVNKMKRETICTAFIELDNVVEKCMIRSVIKL